MQTAVNYHDIVSLKHHPTYRRLRLAKGFTGPDETKERHRRNNQAFFCNPYFINFNFMLRYYIQFFAKWHGIFIRIRVIFQMKSQETG